MCIRDSYLKYATTVAVTAAVLALPSSALTQEATEILEIVAPTDTPTKTVDINVAGSLELQAGMYGGEMIAEKMPVAGVHASTIEEIEGGIVTAWFGGADEGAYDVVIWMSRNEGSGWSAPSGPPMVSTQPGASSIPAGIRFYSSSPTAPCFSFTRSVPTRVNGGEC